MNTAYKILFMQLLILQVSLKSFRLCEFKINSFINNKDQMEALGSSKNAEDKMLRIDIDIIKVVG